MGGREGHSNCGNDRWWWEVSSRRFLSTRSDRWEAYDDLEGLGRDVLSEEDSGGGGDGCVGADVLPDDDATAGVGSSAGAVSSFCSIERRG